MIAGKEGVVRLWGAEWLDGHGSPSGEFTANRVPYITSEAEARGQVSRMERVRQVWGAGRKVGSRILLGWEDRQGQTW